MLVIFREGKDLSPKASFVIQLLKQSNIRVFHVFRIREQMFQEKWYHDTVELATSPLSILMRFILVMLKAPTDLHDEIISRFRKETSAKRSFLYFLSEALGHHFARSTRTDQIIPFLGKLNSPRIFVIDEFFSLPLVDLRELKKLGTVIYVSSDLASDFFGANRIASSLMRRLERDKIGFIDIVVACSERDRLKYLEMGAKNVIFYPNIYPITEFESGDKDCEPSISIVLRDYWGSRAIASLKKVFAALSYIDKPIKIYMIGTKPERAPKNIELQYIDFIPSKLDFLKTLNKSWIGINLGIHLGGTNQRKYDYAMAGLVILSDNLGARGDLLPYEYTYVDSYDLAAKLDQLLELGKEKLEKMGLENRKQALSLAEKQQEMLSKTFKNKGFHD